MNFDVFIVGKKIDLIVLNEGLVDTSQWYQWFNDEEITLQMQKHYFPNTLTMQKEYFKNNIEGNSQKIQCGILHKKDQIMIGIVSLNSIDFLNRKCEIAGLIGEKQYQNLQYIVEALQLLIKHAFEQLNMNRIYGGTIIKEVYDIFVKILGFMGEGVGRSEVYKNGTYHDTYKLGLLRDEYYSLI